MNNFTMLGWVLVFIQLIILIIQIYSENSSAYPIVSGVLALFAVTFFVLGAALN